MKIKNIFKSFVAGAAMLAIAGTASAATTYDINVYGASAQFKFWNSVASDWIKSRPGCSTDTPIQYTFDGNNKITSVTCTGGNTYNLRVSSKASFDGILALKGDATYATVGTTAETCSTGDTNYPGDTLAPFYRKMVDEIYLLRHYLYGAQMRQGNRGRVGCCRRIFPSDFHGLSARQYRKYDYQILHRNFYDRPYFLAKPFIVPFAFFANTQNATLTTALNGNITRLMAVLLFSGHIDNWNELGAGYPDQHVTLCMRHSGSGAHATLDYAVVRGGNGHGAELYLNYRISLVKLLMVLCWITTPASLTYTSMTQRATSLAASILIKAQSVMPMPITQSLQQITLLAATPNVVELAYQGEYASADSIKYSHYDFWTNAWAYYHQTVTDAYRSYYRSGNLLTYAAGHIPDC